MHDEVTVHMRAPADEIWELVADVRNTGRFSPETLEAEWLDGATGPALGARFRGRVKRNGRGCRIADHRADLARLSKDWERATADLDG